MKFDLQALNTPGGFMKKTGKNMTVCGSWPGLSKFQECDMQQALRQARLGDAEFMESVRLFIKELRAKFPHTKKTRIGMLVFWVKRMGATKLLELAQNNLNNYLFEKACKDTMSR